MRGGSRTPFSVSKTFSKERERLRYDLVLAVEGLGGWECKCTICATARYAMLASLSGIRQPRWIHERVPAVQHHRPSHVFKCPTQLCSPWSLGSTFIASSSGLPWSSISQPERSSFQFPFPGMRT